MNKLSQEQRLRLASIVIAVFFASSILSILATVFILQYRRHLASISHKMLDSAIGSKRQMPRPMSGNMRGNLPSSKYPANVAAGRSELTKEFTPKLQQGMALPTKNHLGISSTDWPAFVSPVSPASIDNQVCAVSPPSDRPIDNSGRDDLLRAGPGLYGSETYTSSKFQTTNVPPNEIPLEGYPALHKLQRAHIAGMGTREPTLHNLLFHERIGNAFTSNDIPEPRTGADEELSTREVTNRREGGTAALTPAAKTNAFSAPVIPLRFSSLNAYKSPPSQNSIGSHWDNEAFIAAMDDGTAASGHPFFWNQPRYQSPPQPTYVSRDLTDPNPGIADEQPVSRFSVSTAPLSSIESSSSSPPPVPRHRPQQLEHLEISGLRPAPSSPSQLQSPVPRRPNLAAIVASMEPSTRRALNNSTPTAF
jgi:hypothetical protein